MLSQAGPQSLKFRTEKELTVVGSLAMGDLMYGIGHLGHSIRNTPMVVVGIDYSIPVSRWYCWTRGVAPWMFAGGVAIGLSNIILSFERLFAIGLVMKYRSLGT